MNHDVKLKLIVIVTARGRVTEGSGCCFLKRPLALPKQTVIKLGAYFLHILGAKSNGGFLWFLWLGFFLQGETPYCEVEFFALHFPPLLKKYE